MNQSNTSCCPSASQGSTQVSTLSTNNASFSHAFGVDKIRLHFHEDDFILSDSRGWRRKFDEKSWPLIQALNGEIISCKSLRRVIGGRPKKGKDKREHHEKIARVVLTIIRQRGSCRPCLRIEFSFPNVMNEISNFPLHRHTNLNVALRWIKFLTKLSGD